MLELPGDGLARVLVHFGYRDEPDMMKVGARLARCGLDIDPQPVTVLTSKPTVVSVSWRGWLSWRGSLFAWMLQNSASPASYFGLPPNRVVELGTLVAV